MKKHKREGLLFDDWLQEQVKNPDFRRAYEIEGRRLRFGVKVNRLRTAAKMTQAKLAQKVGVSQAYIAKLETGNHENFQLTTLRKIGNALGFDIIVDIVPRRARSRRGPHPHHRHSAAA